MVRVRRLEEGGRATAWCSDELAVEEPLQIRLDGEALAVTMRTPGADLDLAVGFLLSEGLISGAAEIASMRVCRRASEAASAGNVVEVSRRVGRTRPVVARPFTVSSACGVCGSASIDAVLGAARHDVSADPLRVSPALLEALPERLRDLQPAFGRTGGLHAAALFSCLGEPLCVREDVGRHNAFDKVIGWAAGRDLLPLRSHIILASGRASFELTQKALVAGIPLLSSVSAPSSLAVELARRAGMTLVGFLRGQRMNVYSGQHRVVAEAVG